MQQPVLVTRGLAKRYGHFDALTPTNLYVPYGEIYGLVGRNGAGKTTLLRLITGQALPSAGEVELFGATASFELNEQRRRVGAMIETPSFYPYLTARENLEYYRLQRGIAGRACIQEALELVDLADAGQKKCRDFSLGMKQRLGLALALMNQPDLLLLDEPVNGLDPMGIVAFRNLLIRLNRERHVTIVVSSHILSEMENLATVYGFLDHGVLVEQIGAQQLRDKCRQYVEVRVDDAAHASTVLEQQLHCTQYEVLPGGVLHLYQFLDATEKVAAALMQNGIALRGIEVRGTTLEDYFVSLVGGEAHA